MSRRILPPQPDLAKHQSPGSRSETIAHQHTGFTLIELSIVLVIIGLIAGGVLVGKDLIDMAGARSFMSQMDKYQAAVHTFQLKYNCKPGDCANASQFGLGASGNGDKYLGNLTAPATGGCITNVSVNRCFTVQPYITGHEASSLSRGYGEVQYFWLHLSAAGLIDESITQLASVNVNITDSIGLYFPQNALGKDYLVAAMWGGKLYIRTGFDSTGNSANPSYNSLTFTMEQTRAIHEKMGYNEVFDAVGDSNYPDALAAGQRVVPTGQASASASSIYRVPSTVNKYGTRCWRWGAWINGGHCNLLWQLDY